MATAPIFTPGFIPNSDDSPDRWNPTLVDFVQNNRDACIKIKHLPGHTGVELLIAESQLESVGLVFNIAVNQLKLPDFHRIEVFSSDFTTGSWNVFSPLFEAYKAQALTDKLANKNYTVFKYKIPQNVNSWLPVNLRPKTKVYRFIIQFIDGFRG